MMSPLLTDAEALEPTTILEVVVGSTVHGIAVQDGLEDLDLMAVVLEAAPQMIGFAPRDTWVKRTKPMGVRSEAGDVDYVAYGLRKFLQLASKGNPSLLLAYFVPDEHIRLVTPEGVALRALAPALVSRQAFQPFLGYLRRQHERLLGLRGQRNVTRPELVAAHGYDTKFAAHAVRLGLQGEELLLTGRISLPMREPDRALVLKVRTGGFALDEVSQLIDGLALRLDAARARSSLPERPDGAVVERWMIETYLAHWQPAPAGAPQPRRTLTE
jgi:uncharacterized protein